jgi:uncharacterized protein with GYD domain
MPTYVVLTKLRPAGRKAIEQNPGRPAEINAQVRRLGGKIVMQYATLGEYDFITFVEAEDNPHIAAIGAEISTIGTIKHATLSAIEMGRFEKLLKIQPYRT